MQYASLSDALAAAADGGTVTLLADLPADWDAIGAGDYATVAVITSRLTLDLNGFAVDYLTVGDQTYDEETEETTVTASGDLTVTDSSEEQTGSIASLSLIKGSLAIEGGTIGTEGDTSSFDCSDQTDTVTISGGLMWCIRCEGGTVTVEGGTVRQFFSEGADVTIKGGTGHGGLDDGSESSGAITWSVNGGSLDIAGGTFGRVIFHHSGGKIAISAGTFAEIMHMDNIRLPVMDLLADDRAFYDGDGNVLDGTANTLENVEVKFHTHSVTGGTCPCGMTLAVSVTGGTDTAYYDTLAKAFAAAKDGDTITLLQDAALDEPLSVSPAMNEYYTGSFVLDLNGKTVSCQSGDDDTIFAGVGGALTICDSSSEKTGKVTQNAAHAVRAGSGSTLTITGGSFETVAANGSTEISGGSFSRIWAFDRSGAAMALSSVLAKGYAFHDKTSGAVQSGKAVTLTDVTVGEHTHSGASCACGYICTHPGMDSTTGRCTDCGELLAQASVTAGTDTVYYSQFTDAVNAAIDTTDATVTLLKDVTLPDNNNIYIDAEYQYGKETRFTINWNGHTLSGSHYAPLLNISRYVSVTLMDSSTAGAGGVRNTGGMAVNINVDGGCCVTILSGTYAPMVKRSGTGTVRISGGVFENPEGAGSAAALYDEKGGNLAGMLAEGYTFSYSADAADTEQLLDVCSNKGSAAGKTVYVVAHTHAYDRTTGKCACGASCPHDVDESTGVCGSCGAVFMASVNGGYYTTVTAALAAAPSGSTVTLLPAAVTESVTFSADKSVTLHMDGKTLTAADNAHPALTVSGGTLTVTGDAKIVSPQNTTWDGSIQPAVLVTGGQLVFTGKLTAQGGWYGDEGNGYWQQYAVQATGGQLDFRGDLALDGGLAVQGTAVLTNPLTQGTFTRRAARPVSGQVTIYEGNVRNPNYERVLSLLADGYAFAHKDDPQSIIKVTTIDVTSDAVIVAHTHTWSPLGDGCICNVCGQVCGHSDGFASGACPVCGKLCPHDLADQSTEDGGYYCNECHQRMAARITLSASKWRHFAGLEDAMAAAENGQTVLLLSDVDLSGSGYLPIYEPDGGTRELTLDLNGYTISGNASSVDIGKKFAYPAADIKSATTLKIVGEGSILTTGTVCVSEKATLDLSGWTGGTINIVTVERNGETNAEGTLIVGEKAGHINRMEFYAWPATAVSNTKLYGGSYGLLDTNSFEGDIRMADLLPEGYVFRYSDGTYADRAALNRLSDVSVVKCDHGGTAGFAYDAGSCPYCGAPAVAMTALKNVEGNPWRQFADLQDALDADRDGGSVLRLLTDVSGDYTIDGTKNTGISLGSYAIKGTVYVTGGTRDTSFSSDNTDKAGIDRVVASAGAKLHAGTAVIGTLQLAEGATWENILYVPDGYGYKVYAADGTYKWYDKDTASGTELNNVAIQRLPITSRNLTFRVNNKNVTSAEVHAAVQLLAYCNTNNVDVTFYIQKVGSETPITLTNPTYEKINTSWYYVSEHVFTETGRYTIWFTAAKDGYGVQSSSRTLNITKASIPADQITAPEAVTGLTYTAAGQALVTAGSVDAQYGTMQYSLSRSSGYSTAIPTAINAGTYRVYYKVIGTGDYKDITGGPISVTIAPRELTIANVAIAAKTYDGTTNAFVTGVTFSGLQGSDTLRSGLDYTAATGVFYNANAGSGKAVSGTVTLDAGVKNYTLPDGSYIQSDCTIQQATVADPAPAALTIVNGAVREYTIALPALPELESPKTYGNITYALQATSLNEGYAATAVLDSDAGTVKLAVTATGSTVGDVGTVTVAVTTTNYTPILLTVNVTAAKRTLTPNGLAAGDITYGQTLRDSVLGYNGEYGGMRYNGELVQGDLRWQDDTIRPDRADVFTFDWIFTPTGDDAYLYEETTGTADVRVNKAQFTDVSVRQVGTLTYNGQPQTAAVEKTATVVMDGDSATFSFGTENEIGAAYHKDVPAFTDAGEHTVYYVVYDVVNWDYEYYRDEFTVTIEPKEVTATVTVPGGPFVYDGGTAIEPAVEVYDNGTLIPASEYTVEYGNNTDAGTATVTVKDKTGGNYIVSGSTTFEIDKADASVTAAPAANDLTYTGAAQELVTAGTAEGGVMQYSLDGVTFTDAIPTAADAQTCTVWYMVKGDSNHRDTAAQSVTVIIGPKAVTAAVTVSGGPFVYNGGRWEPPVTVKDGDTVIDAGEYTVEYGSNTNAGTATVTVKDNPGGNYAVSGAATFEIDRAASSVTAAPTVATLTYTGQAQPLVTAGTAEGGTVQYSTDGVTYAAAIPTGTLPGSYTVWYMVKGDGNHNDTAAQRVTVTIDPAELTNVSVSVPVLAYNGKAQTPAITVTADTVDGAPATVVYSETENGTYTASIPSYSAVGSYTLYYRLTAANHQPVSGSLPINVDKGTLTVPVITLNVTNGVAADYTVDLYAALMAALPEGCTFGSIVYDGLGILDEQGYCDGFRTGVSRRGVLTIAVNAVNSTAEGEVAEITAIAETANYQDIAVTVVLRAVNRLIPIGTPRLSTQVITGGQRLDTITLSGIMAAEGKTVSGTFAWAEPYFRPGTGRYTATWVFTPDDTGRYAVVTGTADITVTAPAEPVYTVSGEVKAIDLRDESQSAVPVPDAVVTIRRGLEIIGGWKTTDADGLFSLDGIPAGVYNVVVEWDGRTVTRKVELVDHNVTGLLVEIPVQDVNSELTIRDASGLTEGAIVGGLDAEAASRFTGGSSTSVSVGMDIREVPADSSDPIQNALRSKADGMKLQFVDVSLTLTEDGISAPMTRTTGTLLEIILSCDTGRGDVRVLCSADGAFPAGSDGSTEGYYVDKANGRIHIFTRQSATYAVGYTTASEDGPSGRPSIGDSTSPATGDPGLMTYAVMALTGCTGTALLLRRKREDDHE